MVLRANGIDPVTESMMQWIQQQADNRRDDYDIARRYYHGEHDTALTDRLKKFLPPRLMFRRMVMGLMADEPHGLHPGGHPHRDSDAGRLIHLVRLGRRT